MRKILSVIFLILLSGCATATGKIATLPKGCKTPGEVIRAELPEPARGYGYYYMVYLPPCFPAEEGWRYPVLYLIPGRGGSPDAWFNAGAVEVGDRLILNHEIPPLIMVATENTDSDPQAETIYRELIPLVERQYPIAGERQYRAVAGGSLGGIAAYRLAFNIPDAFSAAGIFGAGAISGEERQIQTWLEAMTGTNRTRIFMDAGDEDTLMLERARVMKTILDEAGIENQLHVGEGGHTYAYWIGNFEAYLKWMAGDW